MTKRIATLSGGPRDGQRFESEFLAPTAVAPGAYEDSIPYLTEDGRLLRAYPTQVYRRTQDDPPVYTYDHTEASDATRSGRPGRRAGMTDVAGERWTLWLDADGILRANVITPTWGGGGVVVVREQASEAERDGGQA